MSVVKNASIIASLLKKTPKPIFLLGAGASVTSGIPVTNEIVSKAAKWAYANHFAKDPSDPRITRSDWYPWLKQNYTWFKEDVPLSDLYPDAVDSLLQPKTERKKFWVELLNPDIKPSVGYQRLVELMHVKLITTVLTTNFDECIKKAKNENNKPHHIDEVRTPSDYNIISSSPLFPLLVFLHGDVNNYSDRNVMEEISNMDAALVDRIIPLLKDHPLVVVGYRGWEPSIMEHLLINNIERAEGYKNGIYWCVRKGTDIDKSTDYVKNLAAKIKTNFSFVEIEGFDHLFDKVIRSHFDSEIKIEVEATANGSGVQAEKSFNLQIAKEYDSSQIDEVLLRTRIDKYCANLGISVPSKIEETFEMARTLNLVRKDKTGTSFITNAGLLLFALKPQQLFPSAKTIIRFEGSPQWLSKILGDVTLTDNYFEKTAEGNLWSQLDTIDEALASVNRPFRLKEGESKDVLPYNPRALKEVVVNALVHRDYENQEPNLIVITPSSIQLKNPGGLVDEVKVYFEDAQMSEEVKKGKRGIKGYRNSVIADLFYGSGAMDKRGSGLADVVALVNENSGHVDFSPNLTNTEFSVMIQSRPEAIDETTSTAQSLNIITAKFSSNIIPVLQTPRRVYFATASISSRNELFTTYPNVSFPPFELFENQLFTLTNLENKTNTLRNAVQTNSIGSFSMDEFLLLKEGEKRFIKLLNDSVKSHFYSLGLIVDPKKRRAYFPRTEQGEREISYQARVKRAKRTVVRPRLAANKEKVRYWEHKAFYYAVKKFGNEWGLFVEPTYVFTLDGGKVLLAPNKVGRLATKKASRDYNLSVLNDTVFWMWILAKGVRGNFTLDTARGESYGDNIALSTEYVNASLNYVDYVEADADEEIADDIDEELDDELTKLADLQREGKLIDDEENDDDDDDTGSTENDSDAKDGVE
jgi:predicted HTH transcriptional regulator